MDIQSQYKNSNEYKETVQSIISETKSEEDKMNEEIVRFFQSDFIRNHYSDSDESNMDTISINTKASSERYHSFSNSSSSDNISCFKLGDNIRDKLSSISSDYEEKKPCPKWAKYFLNTCFCIDD